MVELSGSDRPLCSLQEKGENPLSIQLLDERVSCHTDGDVIHTKSCLALHQQVLRLHACGVASATANEDAGDGVAAPAVCCVGVSSVAPFSVATAAGKVHCSPRAQPTHNHTTHNCTTTSPPERHRCVASCIRLRGTERRAGPSEHSGRVVWLGI